MKDDLSTSFSSLVEFLKENEDALQDTKPVEVPWPKDVLEENEDYPFNDPIPF